MVLGLNCGPPIKGKYNVADDVANNGIFGVRAPAVRMQRLKVLMTGCRSLPSSSSLVPHGRLSEFKVV